MLALAEMAGRAILEIYDAKAGEQADAALVGMKDDESPLTLADLAAHRIIVAGLDRLTPDIPVVSEEGADSAAVRTQSNAFWLVDPLDGTKEFLARNGEFTVNIALIRDGRPVWGVVHAPVLHRTYWGGRELGARRQEGDHVVPIRVADPVTGEGTYRVVASKSHLNAETSAFIERLGRVDLIQAGSSLKFCRVAEGEADVYPRLAPTCEWDTAAAQAVLEGAGGHVLGLDGQALRYGKPDVLNPSFIAASVPLERLGQRS